MDYVIVNTEIKPLIGNLLRINIGKYLSSSDYKYLLIEHDFDNLWQSILNYVKEQNSLKIVAPGNYKYHLDSLQLMLDKLWGKDKESFYKFLFITLKDIIQNDKDKTDFTRIFDNLDKLDVPKQEFDTLKKICEENKSDTAEYKIISKARTKGIQDLCFVIMPFSDDFNNIYEVILKEVTKEFKIKCLKADEIFTAKPIIEDIQENIEKSRFLIADLTGRNPNVFYELGYAHALKKDVLLLTQNLKDVPFDVKHFRTIEYENSIRGGNKLKEDLRSFIGTLLNL